jgi:hypothetical protein
MTKERDVPQMHGTTSLKHGRQKGRTYVTLEMSRVFKINHKNCIDALVDKLFPWAMSLWV